MERKKGRRNTLYLFTRRHQVLVGFEDVSEGFFDVFLFHAGQHGGRQEQRQTPLLPADVQVIKRRSLSRCAKQSSHHPWPVIDFLHPQVAHWLSDKLQSESLTNQRGSATVEQPDRFVVWQHCGCVSPTTEEKQQNDSSLLTQYTWGKLSGTAWYWWLEYTFAGRPGEGPCRISALTQISPTPRHCSSGDKENKRRLPFSHSFFLSSYLKKSAK